MYISKGYDLNKNKLLDLTKYPPMSDVISTGPLGDRIRVGSSDRVGILTWWGKFKDFFDDTISLIVVNVSIFHFDFRN